MRGERGKQGERGRDGLVRANKKKIEPLWSNKENKRESESEWESRDGA